MKKIIICLIFIITTIFSINITYANTEVSTNIQKSGDWEYIELDISNVKRSVVLQIKKNSNGYVAAILAQKNDNKYYEMLLFSTDLKEWKVKHEVITKLGDSFTLTKAMNVDEYTYCLKVKDDIFYYQVQDTNTYLMSYDGQTWTDSDVFPKNDYPYFKDNASYFYLLKNNVYIKGDALYSGQVTFYSLNQENNEWIERYNGSSGNAIRSAIEHGDKIYVFRTQRPWKSDGSGTTEFAGSKIYCHVSSDQGKTWSMWNEVSSKADFFVGRSEDNSRGFLCSNSLSTNNSIVLAGASHTARSSSFGYNDKDEKAAVIIYDGFPPSITSITSMDGKYGDNSIINFNLNVDNISEGTVVHATLNGKKKTIVANNENLSLSWNTNELKKATYEKITFYIEDPDGLQSTYEWKGYIDIDYPLLNLKNLISTYIPDKSNQQRIIIADLDNRKIDTNSQNTYMVENIKDMVKKKNCQLYLIGADNEVTKTLANYFE